MENHNLEEAMAGSGTMNLSELQSSLPPLFHALFGKDSDESARDSAIKKLSEFLNHHWPIFIPTSQAWLALLLIEMFPSSQTCSSRGSEAGQLKKIFEKRKIDEAVKELATNFAFSFPFNSMNEHSLLQDLPFQEPFKTALKNLNKNYLKFDPMTYLRVISDGIKTINEVCIDDVSSQRTIFDYGIVSLLKHSLIKTDYGEMELFLYADPKVQRAYFHYVAHIRRHAARLLTILSHSEKVQTTIYSDGDLHNWLHKCANGEIFSCNDPKLRSHAKATLLNITFCNDDKASSSRGGEMNRRPYFGDSIYLINPELSHWNPECASQTVVDVVFVHGLQGGPYKTWRIADDKLSKKSKMEEEKLRKFWFEWLSNDIPEARVFTVKYKTKLTECSGPTLSLQDISTRLREQLITAGIGNRPLIFITHSMGGLVVKQMLYEEAKNIDDNLINNTMVSKNNDDNLINNTVGTVFYACPHFGNSLAKWSWAMRHVLRPSPVIGDLRESPKLTDLNKLIKDRHGLDKGKLEVLSFCEMKRTPIFKCCKRLPIGIKTVSRKSANPGFGEVVELKSTNHVNVCKPHHKSDLSYEKTLQFLQKLIEEISDDC